MQYIQIRNAQCIEINKWGNSEDIFDSVLEKEKFEVIWYICVSFL